MLCCVPDLSIFNLSSWSPAHSTFRQCTNKYPVIIKLSSKHSHFPSGVDNASSWLEWDSSHFIPGANEFSHYHLNSKLPSKSTMWWIYLKFSTFQWIYEVIIIGVPGAFFRGGPTISFCQNWILFCQKLSSQGGPNSPILFCQAKVPFFCVTLFCQS